MTSIQSKVQSSNLTRHEASLTHAYQEVADQRGVHLIPLLEQLHMQGCPGHCEQPHPECVKAITCRCEKVSVGLHCKPCQIRADGQQVQLLGVTSLPVSRGQASLTEHNTIQQRPADGTLESLSSSFNPQLLHELDMNLAQTRLDEFGHP